MEWLERLNSAMDYPDANIGEFSLPRAAQIACCSPFHFQRMFSYLAEVPLSEYIRRRKMTRAAADLATGSEKIIDLAQKAAGARLAPVFAGSCRLTGTTPPPHSTALSRACTVSPPPQHGRTASLSRPTRPSASKLS